MGDTNTLKKFVQAVVLASPIRLDRTDFCVKKSFDMGLKFVENLFDVRFMFEKINSGKTAKVINEANIKFKTAR